MTRRSLFAFSLAPFFRKWWPKKHGYIFTQKQKWFIPFPPTRVVSAGRLSPEQIRDKIVPVITSELETGVQGTLERWAKALEVRAVDVRIQKAMSATGLSYSQIQSML